MEREAHWLGRVAPGAEAEHEAFVARLGSAEVERALCATGVTRYTLTQSGDRLHVRFSTRTPPDAVKLLRFKRLWPDFWQWEGADPGGFPADAVTRFAWQRPAEEL